MSKPAFQLRKWTHFLALGFGSGLAPKAPGTFGTLAAIPLVWLQSQLSPVLALCWVLLLFLLGCYVCGKTADDIGEHDHGAIVWDEVAGFSLAMWTLPFDWPYLLAAFLLFRFFDIVKPWPIRLLDHKVPGGLGIMLDDMLAGAMALGLILLLVPYLPFG
ncbi:phosphatidylglycerophosphatase A [Rheinheimera sp.]|uniref:phosphatidylglycerophosphatase A family protein n=1 Tax=Rheinheimera sp. TaxID=1869214 RepID=UPI00307D1B7F